MEGIECPYCREMNHTSCPEVMAECAYCGARFAVVSTENQTLVILDGTRPGTWDIADELTAEWQEHGELEKEAIVDRRLGDEELEGADRRLRPYLTIRPMQMA